MNALIALALAAAQQTALPNSVSVSRTGEDWSTVTLTLGFDAEAGDSLALRFPEQWGPAENLTQLVSEVRVSGPDGPLAFERAGASLSVTALPAGPIEVRYDIAQDYEGEPQWGAQRLPGMRPVLQPDYAFFAGGAVLPDFEGAINEVRVSLPEDGAFNRPVDEAGESAPLSYTALTNGLFAFGAFRMETTDGDGLALRSAIRGEWPLDDATLHQVTADTLGQAASLFEDPAFAQYFVMVTPLPELPQGSAVIGSGFDEAFFLLATPNADPENLIHTITHESCTNGFRAGPVRPMRRPILPAPGSPKASPSISPSACSFRPAASRLMSSRQHGRALDGLQDIGREHPARRGAQ